MRKLILLTVASLAVTTMAEAQKSNISKAENMLILQKVGEAKSSIDLAIEHEKTKEDPKTYMIASEVYISAFAEGLDSMGLQKSKDYMIEAIRLDKEGNSKGKGIGKNTKKIEQLLPKLSIASENAAGKLWNEKNYLGSEKAFILAMWFNSNTANYSIVNDTLLLINAGIAAMQAEDWTAGADNFILAAKNGGGGHMSFLRAQYCYQQLKDSTNIEKSLKEGFEMYPQESDMINSLINYYLGAQKNDEALTYLNSAIEKDPNSAQYYFARGCLKEKSSMDEAIKDYKMALEKDANFYNALYNLGVAFYNRGLEKKREASNYYKKADEAINKALIKESTDAFLESVNYIEKTVELSVTADAKKENLKILSTIYYNINDMTKYDEVQKRIKALE